MSLVMFHKTPRSSYRIQLSKEFGFNELRALLPYLKSLGVSHLYLSPYFRARPGSSHGYDVSTHRELNPELGSFEEFEMLMTEMKSLGLGQLFDMVPNHMGILGNTNRWWNDILESGPASPYADYFDIDWRSSLKSDLEDKVLLPLLGCNYGEALESAQLRLCYHDGRFEIRYFEHIFPIAPCTFDKILFLHARELETKVSSTSPAWQEYQSILTAIKNLPRRDERDPDKIAERLREKEVICRRLDELVRNNLQVFLSIEQTVAEYNGTKDRPESFNLLDDLLNAQAYRLAYFQVAGDEINYRRFFDINDLAALSMERSEVFLETHSLLLDFIEREWIDGVRIDHIDGLYDPMAYLTALQHAILMRIQKREKQFYIVVEKILDEKEQLPEDWPVAGTTGYDFMAAVENLFIYKAHEQIFSKIYFRSTGRTSSFEEVTYNAKKKVQQLNLAAELHVLARKLDRISEQNRRTRDFTLPSLENGIREVVSCFPVYRSYIRDKGPSEQDKIHIESAVERAKRLNPDIHGSLFDFIKNTLLLHAPETADELYQRGQLEFTRKFQQVTPPVTAKGVEDTAFYRYNRFIALNEVGSRPDEFGSTLKSFHDRMAARSDRWPAALSATSTHDTKRGEDMRARLNVLSEIPREFGRALRSFEAINRRFIEIHNGRNVPDRNLEYFFYQTLIGSWPQSDLEPSLDPFRKRIGAYMQKIINEAQEHTSWMSIDEKYCEAVGRFVDKVLSDSNTEFLRKVNEFIPQITHWGFINSLSQATLKFCAPGIPDTYQGSELWNFDLVDPDNRKAVDFKVRKKSLQNLNSRRDKWTKDELLKLFPTGEIKLYLTITCLHMRERFAELFLNGVYLPLETEGLFSDNVVSFSRFFNQQAAIVTVPRFATRLIKDRELPVGDNIWGNTSIKIPNNLANRAYRDVFSDEVISTSAQVFVSEFLNCFPVSILISE